MELMFGRACLPESTYRFLWEGNPTEAEHSLTLEYIEQTPSISESSYCIFVFETLQKKLNMSLTFVVWTPDPF